MTGPLDGRLPGPVRQAMARLEQAGIHMQFDQAALSHLAEAGFDPTYGARPLRRAIQSQVEDLAATKMLEGQIKEGDTVQVSAKDGAITIEPLPQQ